MNSREEAPIQKIKILDILQHVRRKGYKDRIEFVKDRMEVLSREGSPAEKGSFINNESTLPAQAMFMNIRKKRPVHVST